MAVLYRLFARISLAIWMVGAVAVGATLQARHLLALPAASIGQSARDESVAMLARGGQGLAVWHVLSADCACSRKVAEHLATRAPIAGSIETIVWVAKNDAPPPQTGALRLLVITPDDLQRRFGAVAAPQLIAVDAQGAVRYVGGYSRSKQGEPQDTAIIGTLATGGKAAALPLFGCAVSEELARLTDPVGVETLSSRGR